MPEAVIYISFNPAYNSIRYLAHMERIDHGDQAKVEQERHAELVDLLAAAPQPTPTAQAAESVPAAIMPKGESAAAGLRAMATNYPDGHRWDKLDAQTCIRGALEIEALRAARAPAESVQRDAERYRSLRDQSDEDKGPFIASGTTEYKECWHVQLWGDECDKKVDEAIAANWGRAK